MFPFGRSVPVGGPRVLAPHNEKQITGFCRFNALLEVVEGIAYNNAPLDLATADGASRNVMALSRGHKVTQTDK